MDSLQILFRSWWHTARTAGETTGDKPDVKRFPATRCSQCGADLGPGDAGVSHCSDHIEVEKRGEQ